MTAAVVLGSLCSGHGCFLSRPSGGGSPNVMINGIPAHRVGDYWLIHFCPPLGTSHDSVMGSGSPNTFTNNLGQARIGDAVACGSTAATGSPNVFVN